MTCHMFGGGIFRYYMLLSIYIDTIHYMVHILHIIDCTVYIYIVCCVYIIYYLLLNIYFLHHYITYHMFCKDQSMNTYLKIIFYSSLILFCSYSMIHSHGAFHVLVQYWFSFCPSPHLLREVSPIFTWVWVWSTSLPVSWLRENGWKTRLVQM